MIGLQLSCCCVEQEIRSQAAAIVGSVDFLGNPMGLINDVSSGLEGLVKRGNVGGLFLNVAHGVSDSAAKVSLTSCSVSKPSQNILLRPQMQNSFR